MLGIRTVEPRAVRNDVRQEKFWATRGKRGDKNMFIKPNGLFQPISGKRGDLAIKPNGFFMMGKRSSPVFTLKPNGFFASFDDKRSLSLKPNGIFSLTKRSNWGTDFHKRYIKPNGLFSIAKRGLDDDMEDDIEYDGDLELAEEDVELVPGKRVTECFYPAKLTRCQNCSGRPEDSVEPGGMNSI